MPTKESAIPQEIHGEASTHDFVKQVLNLLVNNKDAALTPTTLFLDIPTEIPNDADEDNAQQKPPPVPPKEWTKIVYTFQDVQTQANLCTWTGEM